jgi:2'-5' RNA ligase
MNMPAESALVILVPEAESLVGDFRKQYDPSAAVGIPAHVTVLYPFKAPRDLSPDVLLSLKKLFAGFQEFQAAFTDLQRFPNVLYLSPEPADPFRILIKTVAERFPETLPYGGQFTEITPHLTVAHLEESDRLEAVASAFARAAEGRLPIPIRVQAVVLMENSGGLWRVHRRFTLNTDPRS